MTTETRKRRLPWRRGFAVVAVLAASTMVSASGQLSYLLHLPENLPVIEFENDGASHIAYNGDSFSVDAHTTYVTLPNGEQDAIIFIAAGIPVPASGICPSQYFFAYDATGANAACLTDNGWGTLAYRANVIPSTFTSLAGVTTTLADTPVVVPGVADACGTGGTDDLCIQGAVVYCIDPPTGQDVHSCNFSNHWQIRYYSPGVPVLTGKRTPTMTSRSHASGDPNLQTSQFGPFDKFELVVQVTGGVLYDAGLYTATNAGSFSDPRRTVLVEGLGFSAYDPANSFIDWTRPFNEPTRGIASATAGAFLPPLDQCTGQISGSVTDYFNPASGVPSSEVQLTGAATATITPAANGAYQSANNLCSGTYTVTVPIPSGYAANGLNVQTVTLALNPDNTETPVTGINFSLYAVSSQNAFKTFTQGAWGTRPKGTNAGQFMTTYFPLVYPSGELVVGVADPALGFSITMTGAQAVTDLLPQEGKPVVLARSYVDPVSLWKLKHKGKLANHKRIGALAGETLALELNVDFSNLGVTKPGLGALHLAVGALKGQTVAQVLALANSVLGRGAALPASLKNLDALEDVVEAINRNYEAGTVDRKYLIK